MRVLCADDDESIRTLLEVALGLEPDIEAHVVDGGRAALERATRERWDVILLDGMMPDLDGEETCRRLKADPATAAIPVYFLTALSDEAERQQLRDAGAAGFFAKPLDPFALAGALREALGG
ncbi:MAG TPA: response regulator [Gemmatimonadaceae bacterium]|nr:response regulator [Gemmatimonadaceae bacterium]